MFQQRVVYTNNRRRTCSARSQLLLLRVVEVFSPSCMICGGMLNCFKACVVELVHFQSDDV